MGSRPHGKIRPDILLIFSACLSSLDDTREKIGFFRNNHQCKVLAMLMLNK